MRDLAAQGHTLIFATSFVAGGFKPFSGRIVDSQGQLRLADGALDDPAIATMNWFVQGVVGSLPKQ